ncbi:MAG: hypothetical protein V5A68_02190 [Candidatus Thermoplasmatota archaeon]
MRKDNLISVFCISFILLSISLLQPISSTEISKDKEKILESKYVKEYNGAYRYNIQGWIYTYIHGEPYQRGFQHGYLLASEIVDLMKRWSNMIHNHPILRIGIHDFSQEDYELLSQKWWNFCRSQARTFYLDKYNQTPEYKKEIQGITDGINSRNIIFYVIKIYFIDVISCNVIYELLS